MSGRGLFAFVAALALSACVTPDKSELVPFSAAGALYGIEVTEAECHATKDTVWVVVEEKGDCIRYFKSGVMPDENNRVYVWFHGDRISDGAVTASYRKTAFPETQQANADLKGQFLDRPFIQVSRPGVYGSSGNHSLRRTPREVMLMEQALNAIKDRFGIRDFILVGQSGGGHIVASLLAYRHDIRCAVTTSGVVAVKERFRFKGRNTDATGLSGSQVYDPIDHVSEVPHDPDRQVWIIADPRDDNVPAFTQHDYAEALEARGNNVRYIEVKRGTGSHHHGLEMVGLEYALKCEAGISGS